MNIRPDPTFHASPKLAMEAPPENFAYTLLLSPDFSKPDALAVIDVRPGSPTYSQVVHTVTMPNKGDEFHHFGWNACSSALSPMSGHAFLKRRYLIIPGIRSSRIYVVDTQARSDPADDSQDHRARRGVPQDRLFAPAHGALRAGRALHQHARRWGQGWNGRAAGRLPHGLRDLRGARPMGDRSRAAEPALRLLVEPAARLHGVQRMGLAAAVRERHRGRGPALAITMAISFISGICARGVMSRPSTSAPTIRWRWRSGRRTIRCANTASSASWSTPPTSKARSGRGGARAASSTCEKTAAIPPEPAEGRLAATAARLRRRAAAGQRHRPLAGRPIPLRRVLGHRRDAPIRRVRSDESAACRQRAHRRHRRATRRIRTARPWAAARR